MTARASKDASATWRRSDCELQLKRSGRRGAVVASALRMKAERILAFGQVCGVASATGVSAVNNPGMRDVLRGDHTRWMHSATGEHDGSAMNLRSPAVSSAPLRRLEEDSNNDMAIDADWHGHNLSGRLFVTERLCGS